MDNNSASTEFKQLIARGKEQGYLTIEEINDLIPPDIITGDQLSDFIQTFSDMGINVCDTPPDPDDLLLNEASQSVESEDVETVANQLDSTVEIGRTTDPVRMYMREMGNVSLLTRKDEIEISKRIERGTSDVQMCVVEYPLAMQELFRRYEEALDPESELRLGDIVVGFADPDEEDDKKVEIAGNLDEVDDPDAADTSFDEEKDLEGGDDADDQPEAKPARKGKKAVESDEDEDEDADDEDDSDDDAGDSSGSSQDSGPDPELVKKRFAELRVQFDKVEALRGKSGAANQRKYHEELARLALMFKAFRLVPQQLEMLLRQMRDMMNRVKIQDQKIRRIAVDVCGMKIDDLRTAYTDSGRESDIAWFEKAIKVRRA